MPSATLMFPFESLQCRAYAILARRGIPGPQICPAPEVSCGQFPLYLQLSQVSERKRLASLAIHSLMANVLLLLVLLNFISDQSQGSIYEMYELSVRRGDKQRSDRR
jgi:hypothetical protein